MGPKGSNVQAITQDHDVSIKFPDREKSTSLSTVPNGDGGTPPKSSTVADDKTSLVNGGGEEPATNPRHIILITGRQENAEAAKQALIVSYHAISMHSACH